MGETITTMRSRTQLFIASAAVIGLLSSKFLYTFIRTSLQQGYSSQSVVVPVICVYLIWHERQRIFSQLDYAVKPGAVIALAGITIFVGTVSSGLSGEVLISVLSLISVILMIAGAFISLYGTRAFKTALFPFCLLLFMIPLPAALIDRIIVFLQSQSAALCFHLFALCGVPVYRDGVMLTVPGVTIEVAKECSGINSSLALLLTALVVAWQTLRTTSRRMVLVLLTIPLSILKNGVRIVSLTLLALYVDPSFLTGHLHHDGGFVFFLIALSLIYPVWKLLEKTERANLVKSVAAGSLA